MRLYIIIEILDIIVGVYCSDVVVILCSIKELFVMILNLDMLKELLYSDVKIRNKIQKDYDFKKIPENIDDFSNILISSLNQPIKDIRREISNNEVFEAAVKSLGSNSRNWTTFISQEKSLKSKLFNYDPIKVNDNSKELMTELLPYFPGQSCSNDIKAVLRWAEKLTIQKNYYTTYIKQIMSGFEKLHQEKYNSKIDDDKLFICIAGFSANPPLKWEGQKYLNQIDLIKDNHLLKFDGMGYPLSSEFLRNLGWNGFKPDRHIKRLFDYWLGSQEIISNREIEHLLDLISRKNKELIEFIKYSLIGQKISPKAMNYSQIDNITWAVGAYVIKKGKENNFETNAFLKSR